MLVQMEQRAGAIGYGLMGLTWRPDPPSQAESFELMNTAISCGATLFNGGEFYGTSTRHSCHLLREYFEAFPENASKVLLSIKGGMKYGAVEPDASEANLRRSVDECNRVLAGTKRIDIFGCARIDPNIPVEDSIRVLAKLVREGKIGSIGLSEVKADTIRRAHAIHPIAVVEVELSLWTTNILHNGVADICAELGIPIVAYAPLSRGALTSNFGTKNEDLPIHRRNFPKFQDDVLKQNRRLTEEVEKLSMKRGCKPSQIALAWIQKLSAQRPRSSPIIPIPGAEKPEWIRENCKHIELTDGEMSEISAILGRNKTGGERYMGPLAKLAEG